MPKGLSVALNRSMRAKLACLILLTTWIYAAWPSLISMIHAYRYSGYDYQGFLALPIFFVLMQQQRNALNRISLVSSNTGLLLLLVAAGLWLFANITTLETLQQITLISMIPAIIMCSFGRRICTILAFPFLALYLLLPLGQPLVQYFSHLISLALLKGFTILHLGVYWENQNIYIAKQEYSLLHITAALKYLTLYIAVGYVFSAIITKKLYKQILFTSQFALIPLVALFFTFFVLMLFCAWLKNASFANSTITIISWATVSCSLLALMIAMVKMQPKPGYRNNNDGIDWRSDYSYFGSRWFTSTIVASILIAILPIVADNIKTQQHYASGWSNSEKISHTTLKDVAITIKYKDTESLAAKYDHKTWRQIKNNNIKVESNNKKVAVTETMLVNKYHGKLIWTVNYANGHLTNSPVVTKVLENVYALSEEGAKTAQITISTDIGKDLALSRKRLNHALNELRSYEKSASQ